MKIKNSSVYVGDIKKIKSANFHLQHTAFMGGSFGFGVGIGHVETEEEIYKKSATLVKVADCGYVDIDSIHNVLDLLKLKRSFLSHGSFKIGDMIMVDHTIPFMTEGDQYVDSDTLKPYYPENVLDLEQSIWSLKRKDKKLKKLKSTLEIKN